MDAGAGFPLDAGRSPDHDGAMHVHSGQRLLAYQQKARLWILFKPATRGSGVTDNNHQAQVWRGSASSGAQPTLQESISSKSGYDRTAQTHGMLPGDDYFNTEQLKVPFTAAEVCPSKDPIDVLKVTVAHLSIGALVS